MSPLALAIVAFCLATSSAMAAALAPSPARPTCNPLRCDRFSPPQTPATPPGVPVPYPHVLR